MDSSHVILCALYFLKRLRTGMPFIELHDKWFTTKFTDKRFTDKRFTDKSSRTKGSRTYMYIVRFTTKGSLTKGSLHAWEVELETG